MDLWLNSLSPTAVRDSEVFYNSAHAFPMEIIFGVEAYQPISCILPGHDDTNPSARFERNIKGESIYHCYGCEYKGQETMLDIFELFTVLTGFSHKVVKDKIAYLLNMTLETQWQKEKREELREYENLFFYPDRLGERYPVLYKYLKRSNMLGFLGLIIHEASTYLLDKEFTGREEVLYSADINQISRRLKDLGLTGSNPQSIQKKLHIASTLGLMRHLPDNADSYVVKKARLHRKSKMMLQGLIHKYRVSVYEIPTFNTTLLLSAEQKVLELKEKGFSNKAAHLRQSYVWAVPKEEVDKHYVQDTEKNVKSDVTIDAFNRFKLAAEDMLKAQGYFTQQQLLSHKRTRAMKRKKELLAVVTPELLSALRISYTVYSSHYGELYGISQAKAKKQNLKPGRTKLFVPTDDLKDRQ